MQDTQNLIKIKGEEILKRMEGQSKVSLFSKDFWYGSIMDWSMKNEKFKTNMFRFVDVLPSLQSGQDVAKHLKEYFEEGGEMPPVFKVGLGLGSLAPGLMANTIKKNVTEMAKMFITGENPAEALTVLKKARKNKMTFTVDILGEATLSEKEALQYQQRYLELIDWLAQDATQWEKIPQIDCDYEGDIPKINVSVKLTALSSQINDKSWDVTKETLKERLRPILKLSMARQVALNLDMEHYAVKHLTVEVFKELLMEPEFINYKFFGCVIQAYLRDSKKDIEDLIQFAKNRKMPFTIRLVKGAYWDSETVEAEQRGWPIPVYTKKAESDANFEDCARLLLDHHRYVRAALASHNVRSIAAALVHAESIKLPQNSFEIQMLYGMADPIKKSLVEMGYRVREYAPVGELIPGMAYLVRRLLENTSNESWLRGKFADQKTTDQLLRDPAQGLTPSSALPDRKGLFSNEPYVDFAVAQNRKFMQQALEQVTQKAPHKVLPVLNGKTVSTSQIFERVNPSQKTQVIAQVQMANKELAEQALQSARQAFAKWSKTSLETRCKLLDDVADLMTKNKWKLAATQVLEVGKPWSEADADVAEAIDFCRYYARTWREQGQPLKVGSVPGEESRYVYRARGVCLVIAPWNFPLAILAGQVVSALVTGNTVLIKPAEQSSLVAQSLIELLLQAGCPQDVAHFLPGYGEDIGEYLVQHPAVATIAFTGSKAVGLHILQQSAVRKPQQNHVKRCIIEMGGKNALIIDSDADLDEAVDGVLASAFGFAGQKCSAASRVIVLSSIYEKFCERLKEAAASYKVAPSMQGDADLGPVVDEEAFLRITQTIANARKKHTLLFEGTAPQSGFFVAPTIFSDVKADDELAQNEIFGPVLAVLKADSIEHAVQIANATEYALTGGLFSRSPANIQYIKENFECGNLYINRTITGAMVDRHPFGGYKMSGIGSKTGGPDYLKQFVEPIVWTENTMRRGFAGVDGN